MADAGKMGRNSTLGSALILVLLVAIVVAIVAYVALNPGILESLLYIVIIAAVVIVAVIVIIYVIMAILAVPYYAMKGEEYQTDATYDLDDVESVKEKDSRDEKD